MGWVLACVLIALVGLIYLFLQAREVWRKSRLLLGEIETAAARAGEASQPSSRPTDVRET
ncbi:hypothetical protein [Aquipuribacter sp. MA13-13]|uniref:hypothetical protein n=1 Tax=Aquipuribacter sp. MA13-13 TaxID=3440840 RepID=UPI003EEA1D12